MEYNTKLKKLSLPDYGRHIQRMVDYCVTIVDRKERCRCANTIVHIMGQMFPHLREMEDSKDVLWNHLAIMSDFQLDIDYPCEVVRKEILYTKPPRLEYSQSSFRYRHYGKLLERMIAKVSEMEEGKEKERLIALLANQMKRSYMTWNKDSVEDSKILSDLRELSGHRIQVKEGDIQLLSHIDGQPSVKQQQVKKKPANARNRAPKRAMHKSR